MRILQVMEATIGGTRRHIVDLCAGLAREGEEVHLCASAERVPEFRRDLEGLRELGVSVTEIPMVRSIRPGTDLRHLRRLRGVIERVRPDVVHTHASKAGVLGRLASRFAEQGVRIHTPHTFAFLFEATFSGAARRVFFEIERELARDSHLVAVSRDEERTFRAAGIASASHIHVVPNGLDPGPFLDAEPLSREELGFEAGRPLACIAGRIDTDKGQDIALEALAQPGLEELGLVLCGDGPPREAWLAEARRAGVASRVRHLGWRDDIPRVFRAVDFVLLPSRWEGLPYVILEAFAAGRPMIAHPVDGAKELVRDGETGFLASAIGAVPLAEALRRGLALDAEERAALGEAGRDVVLREHTFARMVERLRELYGSLAGACA